MKPSDEKDALDRHIKAMLADPSGRAFLFWVLKEAGIYQEAMGQTPEVTAYTLGRQAFGRKLIARLNVIDERIYPRFLLDVADDAEIGKRTGKRKVSAAVKTETGILGYEDGDEVVA